MFKRIIFVFCILTLCITVSSAGITDKLKSVIARQNVVVGGGPACTTADDSDLQDWHTAPCDSDDADQNIANDRFLAVSFTLAAQSTITEYLIRIRDDDADGDCVAQIYNNNATPDPDEPDYSSPVAGTDVTVGNADIDDTMEDQLFTLGTEKEGMAAGIYWLVVKSTGGSTPHFQWARDTNGCNYTAEYSTDSGSSWSTESSRGYRHIVRGCAE